MLQNCGKLLYINYNQSCCVKHLIEMSEQAEMQLLTNKYAKVLLKTIYPYYKNAKLPLENANLETLSSFLNILTRYISHFFFLGKYRYAQVLAKIGVRLSESTIYREHPEIIIRLCAIRNNVSCIYEQEGNYQRSLSELSFCKKYLCSNQDKAIFYNNYLRIQLKTGNIKDMGDSVIQLKKSLFEEMEKAKADKFYKEIKNEGDVKLISFLMFNLGYALEQMKRFKEVKEIYKIGFEFSICMLGENHYSFEKYQRKIEEYSLNKVETNSFPLESEDEIIFEELARKNSKKKKNTSHASKYEMLLPRIESIKERLGKNELSSQDQQAIYSQIEKIKEMINGDDGNCRNAKKKNDYATATKTKKNKKDSSSSKETNTNTIFKKRGSDSDDIDNKEYHFKPQPIDLLDDFVSERQFAVEPIVPMNNSSNSISISNKGSKPTVPKICFDVIATNDKYECETYYQKTDTFENNNTQSHPNKNFEIQVLQDDTANIYECVTFYMTKIASSRGGPSSSNLIIDECKFSDWLYKIKPSTFDVNQYFDSLIKPKDTVTQKIINVHRIVNDCSIILRISPLTTYIDIWVDSENKHIKFDYDKLKTLMGKLVLSHSLPPFTLFSEITTIEEFTEKILHNFISCNYQNGFKLGISKIPLGIFTKKTVNITIRVAKCTFDMILFAKKSTRILIYSSSNDENGIQLDTTFDDDSFNDLFKLSNPRTSTRPNEFLVNQYTLKADDYTKDTVLMNIARKMQNLITTYCMKRYNTFEDLCNDKSLRFKCTIENHCEDITVTVSEFREQLFKVVQVNSMESIINDGLVYGDELRDIFGYKLKEFYQMTNSNEKTFISQLISNSLQINPNTSKIQLAPWNIVSHFTFVLLDKVCNLAHMTHGDCSVLLMQIYCPLTIQEHCKLLVPNKPIKMFDYIRLDAKIKRIFLTTLDNIAKGEDSYIEAFEV